jgi:hypothetical protein
MTYSSIHHILSGLCISMFHFFFLCCSYFVSTFQNTKRLKIFPLLLFVCFFNFLVLVCFAFYFRFGIWKNPKRFYFVCYFLLVLKFENPKKNCCSFPVLWSLLQCSVSRDSIRSWLSIHIIQATQVKGNNDDYWQFKMWWEAGMNSICFHFCTYTHLYGLA